MYIIYVYNNKFIIGDSILDLNDYKSIKCRENFVFMMNYKLAFKILKAIVTLIIFVGIAYLLSKLNLSSFLGWILSIIFFIIGWLCIILVTTSEAPDISLFCKASICTIVAYVNKNDITGVLYIKHEPISYKTYNSKVFLHKPGPFEHVPMNIQYTTLKDNVKKIHTNCEMDNIILTDDDYLPF